MARARAEPSTGSVPAPNSSNSTSERLSVSFRIPTRLTMWDENVERLCSMLCSSPMSANTWSKIDRADSSATGMCNPAWAMQTRSPTVFRETVLPPVFGPVMTMTKNPSSGLRCTSMGTASSAGSNGCLALRSRMVEPGCRGTSTFPSFSDRFLADREGDRQGTKSGRSARSSKEYLALAKARSSWANISTVRLMKSPSSATSDDRLPRIRLTSRCSSSCNSRRVLLISTVARGSMNRVAPLLDSSWTRPGMRPLKSALSGIT